VAFGGRVLSSEQQPKYLNSPETPIFHKSYTLYGLYEMRIARDRSNHIIVVEGYMDVVALAQFGIRNAVATLGTAVTVEHLDILFRQVSEIVFCFDGDNAGKKAAWKALELVLPLLAETRTVKFLFLDDGEDPDSTVRKEGVDGFNLRVEKGMTISQFLFAGLQEKISLPISSIEGQQQLISLSKPYIINARGAMPDLLTKVLADIVELPVWRLAQILEIRVASTKKVAEKSSKPVVIKAKSIVLQLLGILFIRPQFSSVFEEELLVSLEKSDDSTFRFLAQTIRVLNSNGGLIDNLISWLNEPNKQKVLTQIQQIPLKDDDAFLGSQFESILMQIVGSLADEQKKKEMKAKLGI
jgi:DNA primase